jgi:DnaJ homolog subfamily C member 28
MKDSTNLSTCSEEVKSMKDIADKVFNKTIKEDFGIDMQQTLHMIQRHDLVGTIIAKAMERGEFDNLEGTGKPLNLEENPFEPTGLHLIHKILKDNGFAPYWIELGKEIDALRIEFNKDVDFFKRYTQIFFSEKQSIAAIQQYEQKKNSFFTQSREQLGEISKKIFDYNLRCPVSQLGRNNFEVDDRMSNLIEDIEKLIQH